MNIIIYNIKIKSYIIVVKILSTNKKKGKTFRQKYQPKDLVKVAVLKMTYPRWHLR
jgi:hypothetical protein